MSPLHDDWETSTRVSVTYGDRVNPAFAADMAKQLAQDPDAGQVTLPLHVVRDLLRPHLPQSSELGAVIHDTRRGVRWRVKLGRAPGRRPWLRSVEVMPDSVDPDPRLFTVPKRLADAAADVIAAHELFANSTNAEPEDILTYRGVGEVFPNPDGIPSPEELYEAVQRGESAPLLAERYRRSVGRVYAWLGQARKDRPDLPWPPRRRGPAPRVETNIEEGTNQ